MSEETKPTTDETIPPYEGTTEAEPETEAATDETTEPDTAAPMEATEPATAAEAPPEPESDDVTFPVNTKPGEEVRKRWKAEKLRVWPSGEIFFKYPEEMHGQPGVSEGLYHLSGILQTSIDAPSVTIEHMMALESGICYRSTTIQQEWIVAKFEFQRKVVTAPEEKK